MTSKTKTYTWAVVNEETGRLMRERSPERRALYRTREEARLQARVLEGRAVRRDQVVGQERSPSRKSK